jgi:hypothetical protein
MIDAARKAALQAIDARLVLDDMAASTGRVGTLPTMYDII